MTKRTPKKKKPTFELDYHIVLVKFTCPNIGKEVECKIHWGSGGESDCGMCTHSSWEISLDICECGNYHHFGDST